MTDASNRASAFRLVTLGAPRLEITLADAAPRTVGASKAVALITYLAFAPGRTATRDTLCDLLWGDRPLEQSRPQLRQTLWLIKTQIGSALLDATVERITLAADLTTDAEEFRVAVESGNFERAVSMYVGDFFTGYAAPGAQVFEDWTNLQRTRLRALFVEAAEAFARRKLDTGHHGDAVKIAKRVQSVDKQSQRGWRLLLEARIASGDSLAARADADEFEEWLRTEEWDPEPTSIVALAHARGIARPAQPASDSTKLIAELVGREREFAAIHDAWLTASNKGARIIHIVADIGIGKTRLTRDIIARIRSERGRARYLKANFGERHIPFSFTASFVAALAPAPGARGISSATARTLVSLNPSLSTTYSDASTDSEHLEPLKVGLALLDLMSAIADEEPIAVVLDDMHWCDAASRDALTVLASRLLKDNVLLITTARPRYTLGPLISGAFEIRLRPLAQDEVGDLVRSLARLPETEWARELPRQLWKASDGNPFYVLEALRLCLDIGVLSRHDEEWHCPEQEALAATVNVAGTVEQRIAELSQSAQAILVASAIAAMPTDPSIIAEAGGLPMTEAQIAAAELEQRGFLLAEKNSWRPAHDAVRESVTSRIEPSELKEIHARVGAAMAASDDVRSRKAAIQHFAEAELWSRVAAAAIPFLRDVPRNSSAIDHTLTALLGSAPNENTLARVKAHLPLRFRRPAVRNVFVVGVILLALAAGFSFLATRGSSRPSGTSLIVVRRDSSGNIELRKGRLDLNRWDATLPIAFDQSNATWQGSHALIHVTPIPGSESTAVYSIYPDSGQGEIDIVDREGKRTRLTHRRGEDRPGSFSPDGRFLAFLTTRENANGWSDVALLDMKTRSIRRVTRGDATYALPFWSPDGTRIAFVRDALGRDDKKVCIVDADGSNLSCVRPPTAAISGPLGWLDAHRLLLLPDDARTTGVYQIYDVDAGTVIRTSLRIVSRVSLDPTGSWLLLWSDQDGQRSVHVAPTSKLDLRRLVGQDADFPEEAWFAQPINSGLYLDSIAVIRPSGPLARGVPHRLVAIAWSKAHRRMTPSAIRWRSLTPSISTIDSLGVLLPKDTGIAVIEVSAGGWRTARDTLHIGDGTAIPVLDEQWDDRAFQRWRPFGVPEPIIVKDKSRGSLLINGDGNFFSGAYFRREIDASRGLAMEFELSTPITRTQGQVAIIGVNPIRSVRELSRWDHRTGYLSDFLETDAGCFFAYPTGEGAGATTRPVWFPSLRSVSDASFRIDDGRSYTVRLQVFPDGRCGTAINGRPLTIYPSVGLLGRLLTPIIEGNSENTKIIVRRLTIRAGVPKDIDWTVLRFNGWLWDAIPPKG